MNTPNTPAPAPTAEWELPCGPFAAFPRKRRDLLHILFQAATWQAMDALGTNGILGSNQLDGKLARYMVIQKASPRAKEGLFQRLALAVSLTHSVPIKKQAPSADDEAE